MKIRLIILFFSIFFHETTGQSWQLLWSDEFNGNTLDTNKWIHDIGSGSQNGMWGWGNGELQYYQPQNTVVSNGTLKIIAKNEPNGILDTWNNPFYYSSSRIKTDTKFDFRYGKVQARIKTVDGQGFWPAFWMLPTNGQWPCDGEIDIMEQWGNNGSTNVTTGAAHVGSCPYSQGSSMYNSFNHNIQSGSYADNFHIYEVRWYPGNISWFVDNIQVYSINPNMYPSIYNWPFDSNNWYLILNLAITSSGPNNNTIIPSQIEVDWVRVYEDVGPISGCTDPLAQNYNPNALISNNLCEYVVNFEVNLNCTSIPTPNQVNISTSDNNWSCQSYFLNDSDGDGIWSGSFILPSGSFEYIYCADNWSYSESQGLINSMQNGGVCAPVTDYSSYANRQINIQSNTTIIDSWASCNLCIGGCLDSLATNFDPTVNYDDGTCIYTPSNFNITFKLDMNNVPFSYITPEVNGVFNSWCGSCWQMSDLNNDNIWEYTVSLPSGTYEYKFSTDNWSNSEILTSIINDGCVVSNWGYTNRVLNLTSDTVLAPVCWQSCFTCLNYGCTDSTATNYDPTATVDDGSCQYPPVVCAEDAPTNLSATNVIQNRATINWDNMNSSVCLVDQYRIKFRPVGSSTWTQKTMGQPVGSCLWACNKVEKLILNLIPNTTYEYQMKAWYCGGGASAWTSLHTFTTAPDCPNVGNFAVTTPTTTKATFTWDDSNGTYSFMRIKARVDVTGSAWFNVGGTGVAHGTFTKNKNGLTPGESYRGQARTWCDPNGGAYKSPSWTSLIYWTQPTVRMEVGTTISNLDVYPNPSRDMFNVTFTSEDVQDLEVRVMNVVGEVVYTENLEEFVGEYTKKIDLATYTKGVYFLEITTNNGVVNKKLIII